MSKPIEVKDMDYGPNKAIFTKPLSVNKTDTLEFDHANMKVRVVNSAGKVKQVSSFSVAPNGP